jgi:hypothetical protein
VLVAGFSQRTSVLLLYGWCLLLNGLALAMRFHNIPAVVVLGLGALAATASMARLLLRYREHEIDGGARVTVGPGAPGRPGASATRPARGRRTRDRHGGGTDGR